MQSFRIAAVLPLVLAASVRAQSPAPFDRYLIARDSEIAIARSAAPESLSARAEVLVLGRQGYETAIKGTNGFVCLVERGWMAAYDDPEFLKPEQRAPMCMNPPAVRTHLPIVVRATALVLAGLSKAQMFDSLKTDFDRGRLPLPALGSMCYMLSKQQYFGPKFKHADPHLMFWFAQRDSPSWGAEYGDSPIDVHQNSPDPITTYIISMSHWSDGTSYR